MQAGGSSTEHYEPPVAPSAEWPVALAYTRASSVPHRIAVAARAQDNRPKHGAALGTGRLMAARRAVICESARDTATRCRTPARLLGRQGSDMVPEATHAIVLPEQAHF